MSQVERQAGGSWDGVEENLALVGRLVCLLFEPLLLSSVLRKSDTVQRVLLSSQQPFAPSLWQHTEHCEHTATLG